MPLSRPRHGRAHSLAGCDAYGTRVIDESGLQARGPRPLSGHGYGPEAHACPVSHPGTTFFVCQGFY
jgi:hypothetical protein